MSTPPGTGEGPDGLVLRTAESLDDIPPRTVYLLARLRQQVFVVEQSCPYPDLDGRDLEPGTRQLWFEDAEGGVAATLRVLDESAQEPGLRSIGRVVTAPHWRGRGVAAALMREAVARCADGPTMLYAQAHLAHWYTRFGFSVCGEEFLEDGIPHVPMRKR